MDQVSARDFHIDADHWPPLLARVKAETGDAYAAFRRALTPRFGRVWRDIALGYAALGAVLAGAALARSPSAIVLAAIPTAIAIGFAIAYLQLFIHEAAHWNLARDRRTSDRIANALIAWQVGTSIAAYRRVHFAHHRELGRDGDGERSWEHRLSVRLLIEMVTGVHALRVFLSRAEAPAAKGADRSSKAPLLRGAVIHAAMLATLAALGDWAGVLGWLGGMGIVFPLVATLRPLLEHRPSKLDSPLLGGDRAAVTRVFDDGPFARVFGGAGFNRHLLHHWEPQISYTRLAEFDAWLARTSVGAIVDARRTTYGRAFRELLASDNGR